MNASDRNTALFDAGIEAIAAAMLQEHKRDHWRQVVRDIVAEQRPSRTPLSMATWAVCPRFFPQQIPGVPEQPESLTAPPHYWPFVTRDDADIFFASTPPGRFLAPVPVIDLAPGSSARRSWQPLCSSGSGAGYVSLEQCRGSIVIPSGTLAAVEADEEKHWIQCVLGENWKPVLDIIHAKVNDPIVGRHGQGGVQEELFAVAADAETALYSKVAEVEQLGAIAFFTSFEFHAILQGHGKLLLSLNWASLPQIRAELVRMRRRIVDYVAEVLQARSGSPRKSIARSRKKARPSRVQLSDDELHDRETKTHVAALRKELHDKNAQNIARTICQRMDRLHRNLPKNTKWGRDKDVKTWMDAYTRRTGAVKAWISKAHISLPE